MAPRPQSNPWIMYQMTCQVRVFQCQDDSVQQEELRWYQLSDYREFRQKALATAKMARNRGMKYMSKKIRRIVATGLSTLPARESLKSELPVDAEHLGLVLFWKNKNDNGPSAKNHRRQDCPPFPGVIHPRSSRGQPKRSQSMC